MDEDGDLLKATNDLLDQDSSSSRLSDFLNNNERVDGKPKEKQIQIQNCIRGRDYTDN